jgi:hypothetical protein
MQLYVQIAPDTHYLVLKDRRWQVRMRQRAQGIWLVYCEDVCLIWHDLPTCALFFIWTQYRPETLYVKPSSPSSLFFFCYLWFLLCCSTLDSSDLELILNFILM